MFKVFIDLLRNPEFRADKLDLAQKEDFDESISRRNDDVAGIARREAAKLAYGANNPYAREPEYATVAAVNAAGPGRTGIRTHVQPNNIILGIVGDFDSAAMEAKLRKRLWRMAKGPACEEAEIRISARQARLLLGPERRCEPERDPHGRHWASRATIRTTSPSRFSTKRSAADFLRACSGYPHREGSGLLASAAASAPPSIIPASRASRWAPRAQSTVEAIQALYEGYRRSGARSRSRTTKSNAPRTRS